MVLDQIFRGKIFLTYFRWFSLNNNFLFLKVMLSFGKAPAKSCGRGNSSTLPDYLPEDDEDTVISDKVSKEYPTQQTLFTCSRLFKNRVSKLITAQLSHGCSIVVLWSWSHTLFSTLNFQCNINRLLFVYPSLWYKWQLFWYLGYYL